MKEVDLGLIDEIRHWDQQADCVVRWTNIKNGRVLEGNPINIGELR
jgi:hypothetical protein